MSIIEEAKRGNITDEMKAISKLELISPDNGYRVYTQFGKPKVKACTMCGGYCPIMWAMEQVKKVKE
jgi:thiamine biosynthesis protein ThiC